jgi:CheY-like chemotaxis protein
MTQLTQSVLTLSPATRYKMRMKKIIMVYSAIVFFEKNRDLLNRSDFRIYTAVTGKEALRIHRKNRVHMIVADLNMPDMDGDELCELIRSDPNIKNVAILLACRNIPEELERVARCGSNDWVEKPIQSRAFLEKIGQLLEISIRKDYRVILKASVRGERDNKQFFCTSYNISTSGILIETGEVLNQGDRLTCTFFLPGDKQIVAEGEAIRSVSLGEGCFHYGIRFIDLAPDFRVDIESYIDSLVSR